MTGKTGLVTVMIEEAARVRVPTLVIDVKGRWSLRHRGSVRSDSR
jgi:hypothetical protein